MKLQLKVVLFFILILLSGKAQQYTSIKFQYKRNVKKAFVFKIGSCTSMKVGDSIYIIPIISKIDKDSLTIMKRYYYSDTKIEWKSFAFPLTDLIWINWDGIPRKKIRAKKCRIEIW